MTSEHRFALSGLHLPGGDDIFGIWDASADGPVSYEAYEMRAAAPAPAAPTWHIQLPDAPGAAQRLLDARDRALRRGTEDVQEAARRMMQIRPTQASYALRAEGLALRPEDRLLDAVQALRSPRFGVRERAAPDDAQAGWQRFLHDTANMFSYAARVETQIGAVPVGYTAVSWTGHYDTTWQQGVVPAQMNLHRRSLHLALAWRIALLRLVVVVGRGAAKIAARLAVPGPQQALVVPEVWRFVQDVLAELRALPSGATVQP